ncbi:hypothetical protein EZH22_21170 [Xanthobacter dioxanivorans]|uniref:YCII-related domain-containing protein n=1 Tax=Xanthobacter dioxanivorans TaxID=2528964 RepID=A0A974PLI6_9HYPH|nr:YciI family protein [Xanthobacter dioxanivorans]QRG05553.1 hypothetical protein EZH22_21170 [Xanthobacter dioxanivorans]
MIFVVHRIDAPGKSAERTRLRAAHIDYLKAFEDRILAAGPYCDPETGEDRGSMFLIECDTLAQARAFAQDDPFTGAGIFSDLQVWEWTRRMGSLAFSPKG